MRVVDRLLLVPHDLRWWDVHVQLYVHCLLGLVDIWHCVVDQHVSILVTADDIIRTLSFELIPIHDRLIAHASTYWGVPSCTRLRVSVSVEVLEHRMRGKVLV